MTCAPGNHIIVTCKKCQVRYCKLCQRGKCPNHWPRGVGEIDMRTRD